MKKLLPCPFCGSPAKVVDDFLYGFYITCSEKHKCFVKVQTLGVSKLDTAIDMWNMRRVNTV